MSRVPFMIMSRGDSVVCVETAEGQVNVHSRSLQRHALCEGEKVRDLFSPYKQQGPSSSNYCGSASCWCGVTRRFPIGCYEQIKTQKRSVIRVERKPELGAIIVP
ncbi:hypothetical protein KOW79_004875 [Hemibagrus wyckioides]|uniref:Uncharacterized protein n=1 Tax=Hemibagrus wyckioides TaxID=337641 RepID=A0A9D3SN46_9TELE|nr:hypothetical protein KOW79_004875 [Hemibagrus wyckioides]